VLRPGLRANWAKMEMHSAQKHQRRGIASCTRGLVIDNDRQHPDVRQTRAAGRLRGLASGNKEKNLTRPRPRAQGHIVNEQASRALQQESEDPCQGRRGCRGRQRFERPLTRLTSFEGQPMRRLCQDLLDSRSSVYAERDLFT